MITIVLPNRESRHTKQQIESSNTIYIHAYIILYGVRGRGGMAELVDARDLEVNLSARRETSEVELP